MVKENRCRTSVGGILNSAQSINRCRRLSHLMLVLFALGHLSCGYQVKSSVGNLPSGIQSLGIPTFKNSSPQFKVEQRISSAVLKEFTIRTRIPVRSDSSNVDAVLVGDIGSVSASPVAFNADGFASTFLVTVQIRVKLMKAKDSAVLWENNDFLFRERYLLNREVKDFFSEENPALDRLAHDFASSLVSLILNR
jgi:hypothetical protein